MNYAFKLSELKQILNSVLPELKDDLSMILITNISFEPYFDYIIRCVFAENLIAVKLSYLQFEDYNNDNNLPQIKNADIIVVLLDCKTMLNGTNNMILKNYESNEMIFNLCEKSLNLYNYIKSIVGTLIIWFGFEDFFYKYHIYNGNIYNDAKIADRINSMLYSQLPRELIYIDFKQLISSVGADIAFDSKGQYRWNSPYSQSIIELIAQEVHKQYLIQKGITKKCLILDCDNVLWGGILSEDRIENIKLSGSGFGLAYQNFQRFVLELYYNGVILAVCSKNDLNDVLIMFREHSEMILKEEHIACFQVNWNNKVDNIKRIAETLSIGLDSMVFIDDSLLEVEAVRSMLPEVTVILYERDLVYKKLSCFNLKSNVSIVDIEKRNETYRTNQFRETLKAQYDNYDEYIASLEIKMDIHKALPIEYSRIAELTQRTNKCTNSKRYTVAEIKKHLVNENVNLYALSVFDRYSDLGLVGALEVESNTLALFCLSCRALGRDIEKKMLAYITDKHHIQNIDFKSTGKNEDIKAMLHKAFPSATITNCPTS